MGAWDSANKSPGHWAWLCAAVMLGFAAVFLILFSHSPWAVIAGVVLLACPAVIVWGMFKVRRRQ